MKIKTKFARKFWGIWKESSLFLEVKFVFNFFVKKF